MKPQAHLISWTQEPLHTLWKLWFASKGEESLDDKLFTSIDRDEMFALFFKIYSQEIPVIENIVFTFILENVSVSFREQMVRHRVGVRAGDRIGADIIPDLSESSFWSQSMRILNMGNFAHEGKYRTADSILANPKAQLIYNDLMMKIENAYNQLVELGIPMEDARDTIPIGATHRISWTLNLRAMKHVIGKRSCWVLQGSLWHDVIKSMIQEMSEKVHPIFQSLASPPCVEPVKDEFQSCVFVHENERRMSMDDKLPVCPLWLYKQHWKDDDGTNHSLNSLPFAKEMVEREKQYAEFWKHNPHSWEKLV